MMSPKSPSKTSCSFLSSLFGKSEQFCNSASSANSSPSTQSTVVHSRYRHSSSPSPKRNSSRNKIEQYKNRNVAITAQPAPQTQRNHSSSPLVFHGIVDSSKLSIIDYNSAHLTNGNYLDGRTPEKLRFSTKIIGSEDIYPSISPASLGSPLLPQTHLQQSIPTLDDEVFQTINDLRSQLEVLKNLLEEQQKIDAEKDKIIERLSNALASTGSFPAGIVGSSVNRLSRIPQPQFPLSKQRDPESSLFASACDTLTRRQRSFSEGNSLYLKKFSELSLKSTFNKNTNGSYGDTADETSDLV